MKRQTVYGIIGIAVLLLIGAGFWNRMPGYGPWSGSGGWHMGSGAMGPGYGGMGVIMLVFWGLVLFGFVLLIGWLLRLTREDPRGCDSASNAVEILRQRYARGEIDRAEFQSKLRDLTT